MEVQLKRVFPAIPTPVQAVKIPTPTEALGMEPVGFDMRKSSDVETLRKLAGFDKQAIRLPGFNTLSTAFKPIEKHMSNPWLRGSLAGAGAVGAADTAYTFLTGEQSGLPMWSYFLAAPGARAALKGMRQIKPLQGTADSILDTGRKFLYRTDPTGRTAVDQAGAALGPGKYYQQSDIGNKLDLYSTVVPIAGMVQEAHTGVNFADPVGSSRRAAENMKQQTLNDLGFRDMADARDTATKLKGMARWSPQGIKERISDAWNSHTSSVPHVQGPAHY
jgi:hypothetical protein